QARRREQEDAGWRLTRTITPPGRARVRAPGRRSPRRPRLAKALPYVLLLPALVAELSVHIVPMLVGAWMSLLHLTQFFIRNWTQAPYGGLANYRIAVNAHGPVGKDLLQSFLVTVGITAIVVGGCWLFGLTAAVLLQRPFRGRAALRTLYLVPYALLVFTAVITWRFMFQRGTGMVNALLSDELKLAHGHPFWLLGDRSFAAVVVIAIWRMWPFAFLTIMAGLQSIPGDLYEAARVDGAGPLRTLLRVVLPVAAPGVVAVAIYAFMTAWGEVLFASALTDDSTRTLAVGLRGYATQANVYWNQVMAASLVISLPVVVGFLALQRFLVHGLTAGAVKS
ncbi:MAG: ABC transporter permease subunit, partial [Actinoallomurus sp.]